LIPSISEDPFVIAGANESTIGKSYDIRGQERRSPFELAKQVADVLGKKLTSPEEDIADQKEIQKAAFLQEEQLFSMDTGWKPRVDLAEGIGETASFYESHKREYWKGAPE
jgi:nucleoside-diphosphate-sugar epimerase